MTDDEKPIKLKEAAERFGFTVSTLRAEANRDRLTTYMIGRCLYTTQADIRGMVDKCRVEQKAPASTLIRNESNGSSATDRFIRTGCGERDGSEAEKYLAQYIGQKHKPETSGAPMIADMLTVYGNEVAPGMKSARLIAYHISNLLKWWGDKTAAQITMRTCKEFCATRPPQAAIADLKTLKAAADYWHRSEYGPLNFQPVFWRPKANPPKERWLTKQEAARLVKAAKPYLHLRRMILLGLHTGSRPGVILALRWTQIDLKSGVMRRTPSGVLQDGKKRAPPVRLGRKILGHLRRWKRLDGNVAFVCHFEGRAVDDPHQSWRKVIKAAKLPGVTRHTLRHTRAT